MNIKTTFKKGFTLAEIIIALTIMGVIAAIVIPNTIKNSSERAKKAKLRKALVTYDKAINNMMIENDLQHSVAALVKYAHKDADNCANIRRYFKVSEGEGCSFRGVDGLWWDFGSANGNGAFNIIRPRVAFESQYLDDPAEATGDGYNAFIFVSSFDNKGNLRINDLNFEKVSGSDTTQQETQKVVAYLEGQKDFHLGGNVEEPVEQRFCIGDWCFIDDQIINIPAGSMCQSNLHSSGWWTDCVQGEAREICALNDETNATTCGYCITNPNSFACRRGGYYCAKIDANHMECHINGGMVSDIQYDKNGCVTWVQCNSWNKPCNNGGSKQALAQCTTALCSYKDGQWVTDSSDLDKEFFEKFIDDWTAKTGGNRELCGK